MKAHHVVAVLACLAGVAVGLVSFRIAPAFMAMFADFEATATLPLVTRVTGSIWFPLAAGLSIASPGMAALARPRMRWIALGASAGLSVLALGVFFYGMYAPIFEVAGAIRAD